MKFCEAIYIVFVGLRKSEFEGVVRPPVKFCGHVKFCGRIDLKNIMVIYVLQLFT